MTIYPAAITLTEMAERLNALPQPSSIERRGTEDLPQRPGLQVRVPPR